MPARTSTDQHAALFTQHRRALLGAAYRVLGTVADSEDAVQETWLRWQRVNIDEVHNPRSYLLRAATRTALSIARSRQRRREEYVGPWLPEPVSTDVTGQPGPMTEVAEDVTLALLVVLESLSPLERAAFVLREVFGLSYSEIGAELTRGEPAVRQLVSRARAHVRDRAPRNAVDPDSHRQLAQMFLDVARGQVPVEKLMSHLAPGVVLTTDGGGRARAALWPIYGPEKVMRFTAGVFTRDDNATLSWHLRAVNGTPALVACRDAAVDTVIWFETGQEQVVRIQVVRNPQKLRGVVAR